MAQLLSHKYLRTIEVGPIALSTVTKRPLSTRRQRVIFLHEETGMRLALRIP